MLENDLFDAHRIASIQMGVVITSNWC